MQLVSTAKTLVFNEKGQVLILRIGEHTLQPQKSYTDDLPGGIIDVGESERDGAAREIEEETGIVVDAKSLRLVYADMNAYQGSKPVSISRLLYMIKLDHTPEVKISWEHESYRWVDFTPEITSVLKRNFYVAAVEYVIKNGLHE